MPRQLRLAYDGRQWMRSYKTPNNLQIICFSSITNPPLHVCIISSAYNVLMHTNEMSKNLGLKGLTRALTSGVPCRRRMRDM